MITRYEVMPSGAVHTIKASQSLVESGLIDLPALDCPEEAQKRAEKARKANRKVSDIDRGLIHLRANELRVSMRGFS